MKFWIEFWGYAWLLFLIAGVWYAPMRWRLISTSIISIFISIILVIVENNKK